MSTIVRNLQDLGLTDKESAAYLALYRLGEATAYQIAKECGLKRPTVYLVMEDLRKKGLALITPHKKNQVYVAKDPDEFIDEVQQRVSLSSRKLLAGLPAVATPATTTKVFKGSGALEQGLTYGMHSAKDKNIVAFYAGLYPRTKVAPEYGEHIQLAGRLGFKMRSILPSDSRDEYFRSVDARYAFESKRIDREVLGPGISVEVFGSCTKFLLHKKKEVVVIEDQATAAFLRQLFELTWNSVCVQGSVRT